MAKDPNNNSKEYLRYAGVGFEILGAMLLCVGLGYGLDKYVQTEKPWFTLGFSLLGCVVVILIMIRSLGNTNKS